MIYNITGEDIISMSCNCQTLAPAWQIALGFGFGIIVGFVLLYYLSIYR